MLYEMDAPAVVRERITRIIDVRELSPYLDEGEIMLCGDVMWIASNGNIESDGHYSVCTTDDGDDHLLVVFASGARAVTGRQGLARWMAESGQVPPEELR